MTDVTSLLGPLPAFNFYIALIEDPSSPMAALSVASAFVMGGFTECSGLESEIQIEEIRAGGLGEIGPAVQVVVALAMVLGRLETLAIVALLNPEFWRA